MTCARGLRAPLFQNDTFAFDADHTKPTALIDALASRSFSRVEFLSKLDRFYLAIQYATAPLPDGLDEFLLAGYLRKKIRRTRQVRDQRPRSPSQRRLRHRRLR